MSCGDDKSIKIINDVKEDREICCDICPQVVETGGIGAMLTPLSWLP